ncbi:MAG: protein-L-isoaspartate O-methyltransferase [Nitrosomonadales bacterium]|nr:MAG: protein-L-isoaspartate O-methyltransferase [Nitrosomonadales bacterium]
MNFEQARFNMVEQQIRPWNVLDPHVLNLLLEMRREDFVPDAYRNLAFVDMEIPIGHGEVMLTPKMEARIVQELAIKKTDTVLEVGTGSGYMTALLAQQSRHVYSVEIVPELKERAAEKLRAHGVHNVTLELGDAARGWNRHGFYDVIVLTGSVPVLPEAFFASLNPGGRMFAVVGDAPTMEGKLITCLGEGACRTTDLFETTIPPLRNALQPQRFTF